MEPIYVIARNYEQFRAYANMFDRPERFVYLQYREQIAGLRHIEVVSLEPPMDVPRQVLEELHIRNLAIRYDNCDNYDYHQIVTGVTDYHRGVSQQKMNPVLLLCGI